MKIFIQNMVSLRCKLMVKLELEKLGIAFKYIELGEVKLVNSLSAIKIQNLKISLHKSGLEIMENKETMMIEKIINIIIEMVHYSNELPPVTFSTFLQKKMKLDYHKMAGIFSKTKGVTIEHFIIKHKIEKVKELITYDKLNLTEISYMMKYSSLAHLSRQFKQITGLTPTFFKSLSNFERTNLEDL